jgi:hypothetical protein
MAQEKIYNKRNRKIAELKDLLAKEKANLKIMWIPAHVGIGGNEVFKRKRQNNWSNSGNTMAATKPDINRCRSTEGMPRRHQVIFSKLRMG